MYLSTVIRTFIATTTRQYSSTAGKLSQSPLAILRKSTGYPFSKCKEALCKHNNDVTLAEVYLKEQAQKEGWAKAEKVKGRTANRGLIGVLVKDNKGVMVEVNCETDFVAKNKEFHQFVANIVQTYYNDYTIPSEQHSIERMSSDTMATLDTGTIADLVAKNIGHFGENIIVSRGCVTTTGITADSTNTTLSSFVYNDIAVPNTEVVVGTYASLVLLRLVNVGEVTSDFVKQIGAMIGQHVVGMNPAPILKNEEQETDKRDCLVDQPYILNTSVSVGDFLKSHDLHVTDFVRYELGEQ